MFEALGFGGIEQLEPAGPVLAGLGQDGLITHRGLVLWLARCHGNLTDSIYRCRAGTQPGRVECASIHAWASALISRTSRPAATIAGPMRTRIVPARLSSPRRGQ